MASENRCQLQIWCCHPFLNSATKSAPQNYCYETFFHLSSWAWLLNEAVHFSLKQEKGWTIEPRRTKDFRIWLFAEQLFLNHQWVCWNSETGGIWKLLLDHHLKFPEEQPFKLFGNSDAVEFRICWFLEVRLEITQHHAEEMQVSETAAVASYQEVSTTIQWVTYNLE